MRAWLCSFVLLVACGGDGSTTGLPDELSSSCADLVDTFYDPPSLPAFDPSRRGDVVRCRFEKTLTAAQLGGPSGANVYRIAFRTTRHGGGGGISAAWLLVPTVPRAAVMPIVVAAHGTVGLAEGCAPTRGEIGTQQLNTGLAGAGWLVIAPDYAGFGFGDAVHGWSLSDDETYSTLDAIRAVRKLLPASRLAANVALVGHSQGGHAVLSAQSLAASYGVDGTLRGVVGLAPLWLPPRTWGALLTPSLGLDTTVYRYPYAYGLLYFYGHGELYDGDGLSMFLPEKRDTIRTLLTTQCTGQIAAQVTSLGNVAADFFDPDFALRVSDCATYASGCDDPLAATWLARFTDDRPVLDGDGAPVVVWQGGGDTTIPPARARCGIDTINAQLPGTATICGDPDADHGTIVPQSIAWVNAWLGARLLGEPEPAACAGVEALGPEGETCAMPPPNQ